MPGSVIDPDSEMLSVVCPRVRLLRQRRRMSQESLAASAGCYRSYISMVESGIQLPTIPMLVRLAVGLRVPTYILLAPPARFKRFVERQVQ